MPGFQTGSMPRPSPQWESKKVVRWDLMRPDPKAPPAPRPPVHVPRETPKEGPLVVSGPPIVREVVRSVADTHGISPHLIVGRSRCAAVTAARQEVYYWLRHTGRFSMPRIGRWLDRDHTTVLHGIRQTEKRFKALPPLGPLDRG
jgi:Bacterial dnaA protein helix-turn-helix